MDLLLGVDQKVDLFRDGNLGTNRHADRVAQCPLSGATRKTSALGEYFAFLPILLQKSKIERR
jgi:hypothetical protein